MVSAPLLAAAVALAASPASAFVSSPLPTNSAGPLCATDDASAQALSDYMAKSHEEKLRAVKVVEDKKNEEIAALKAEIEQLRTSSSLAVVAPEPTLAAPSTGLATSELEAKLVSYQSFMTEYIVNAQNQKLLAVKEAELKAEKKFQERLEKLFEAGGMALPGDAPAAEAAPVAAEETVFQKRNKEIIAAAAAGKSRWGNAEIERAIAQQAAVPVAAAASTSPEDSPSLFELRNAQVAAAGAAGKSRWGDLEVAKASGGSAPAVDVAVEEKKPVTLEERVNLGARLLAA